MKFRDQEVRRLDLTDPRQVRQLLLRDFCTKNVPRLSRVDEALLHTLLRRAAAKGVGFEQFNELLLLLKQNRVSSAFFDFFLANGRHARKVPLKSLTEGVARFRGLAMLRYGNFTFARRMLTRVDDVAKIRGHLGVYAIAPDKRERELSSRPRILLDTAPIPRELTWLTGETTHGPLKKELHILRRNDGTHAQSHPQKAFSQFSRRLNSLDAEAKKVQATALSNSDVYLTWDYMDVYVATSMRNEWEFEETFDFIRAVYRDRRLKRLKVRYFDPTQCKCRSPRDKGLVEGLMLNRAACTIYMAQESDTLGKDSELAATLAQGKPVIAYVPRHNPRAYARKISAYPLEFFKKRLLILDAEGHFEDPKCEKKLAEVDQDYDKTINSFLQGLEDHRQRQPFTLARELDEIEFKRPRREEFRKICGILAAAEVYAFDKRAELLQGRHPLSMQVNTASGVANGVLVVRSARQCANLLYNLLTNRLNLEIVKEGTYNTGRFTVLREAISTSPFRVVTDNERLTNSFWNLFRAQRALGSAFSEEKQ